ncbi:MAG: hypothetical protein Q8M76_12505, partial [Spirochaetaceae bacterium]|nr:hypothetical protein [Spirochaetaceae bacterium]
MKPFRLILHYSRRYSLQLSVTAASMLLLVGAQLLVPQIIRSLVAAVTEAATSRMTVSDLEMDLLS